VLPDVLTLPLALAGLGAAWWLDAAAVPFHAAAAIAGYLAFRGEASQPWRLFLMTGILGGYTTFSAFSLDAALLYERGELGLAALYVLGSVVLSIAGLFAGLAIIRSLT
jgi:protein CrcB